MKDYQTSDWRFTCEYTDAPLGIDNPHPRFSWTYIGQRSIPPPQESYHIQVTDEDGTIRWDSGRVASGQSWVIPYDGQPLASATRYAWQVEIGLPGASVKSCEHYFETGLLHENDWSGASWIGAPSPVRGVAPLFRRIFWLAELPKQARLYLSGLGYAEVWVNGSRVESSRLDPGWTDYRKTVLYRTWDVTKLLWEGENVLAVELGEGWQGLVAPAFLELVQRLPPWLDFPKLKCKLWMDGHCIVTSADSGWLTGDGGVRANSIYDGERFDARLEKKGWNLPGYIADIGNGWQPVAAVDSPSGTLRSQQLPPIQETERIKPVYIDYPSTGGNVVVADLGVNIAGWVEIEVQGKPGQWIRMRYAEVCNADGSVNQANLRHAQATDIYILGGEDRARYHPRFTYHGFRYVQLEIDEGVVIHSVVGVCVNTGVNRLGDFQCANRVLRDTYRAVLRTECNNLHSVPTDCPQRDERLGWLNDMAVRCEEAIYNFDMALFYDKWLQDIVDAQNPESGALPDTAPHFFGSSPGDHPTSTLILIPWFLYLYYGDLQPMRRHYDAMCRYVRYKLELRSEGGVLSGEGNFGEWAAPMTVTQLGWGQNAIPNNVDHGFIVTSYLYYDCLLMSRVARLLHKPEDADYFVAAGEELKNDINIAFQHTDGYYGENSQGENAFAHFLGMEKDRGRGKALAYLLADLREENNWHTTTGNQMTKYLYEALGMAGLIEDGFRLAAKEDYPSIGFMLSHGATTIWERWEHLTADQMNSHDHPMLGAYSVWLQKYLAGIRPEWRDEEGVIFRVAPGVPQGLRAASAAMPTPTGIIECSWIYRNDCWSADISIPWNTKVLFTAPSLPKNYEQAVIDCGGKLKPGGSTLLEAGQHHVDILLSVE